MSTATTPFQTELEQARRPKHSGMYPFTSARAEGRLTREQLGRWAVRHDCYIEQIPQQFAILYSRFPDPDARLHMRENLLMERMIGAVRASGQLRWAFLSGMYQSIVPGEEL
ncbi:MAG: hypothetical protein ACKV2V_20015 [Blastocatellia bacterium]